MVADGGDSKPVRWRFANAEYNERSHELTVAGTPVPLEPKPLEVLLCLLRAEGELVTKEELFATVWAERVVTDGVLSQAIRRIREVLDDRDRTMLRTVHGYGFRLDVPIVIEGRDDPGTRLQLEAGQDLPNLPGWVLEQRLQTRPANELWRIRDTNNGQLRVVKLALDERAQRALKREVTLNKVLRTELGDSAPLVPLLAWQFDSNPAWIQMPWYELGSLADWLDAQGGPQKLPMPRRLRIVAEAAEALAGAHALGVMHKDIKPGNLLIENSGNETRLLLCDFGSGTIKSRDRLEQAGVTVMGFTKSMHADASTSGTPAYMAPEVLKGGVFSEQSDIYALGILLYQLVIGDLNQPMAPGWEEDVADTGLRRIIADACAGKPARRLSSMRELAQSVRSWQPQPTSTAAPPARPATLANRSRGLQLTALALLVGALGWFWPGLNHEESDALAPSAPPAETGQSARRVAILAFDLLGLDDSTQTVMAGLQDALLADLAGLSGFRLVQGQNLAAIGLADASTKDIGRTLDADQLIRGSVQQLGEHLRVNLQIIDVARNETIWGHVIEGTRSDLFALQSDIGQNLANALGTRLSSAQDPRISNEAYEAYLAALSMWKGQADQDNLAAEIDRALSLAPDFIDAHLLGLMKSARDYWFSEATRAESEARIARHLAALEDNDAPPVKLATARAVRRYYLDHDPAGGVEILAPFRRHIVGNTEAALVYAYMLRRIGRADDAFTVLDQVMERDPSAPVPVETKAELLAFLGRGGEAQKLLQTSAERFGGHSRTNLKIASFGYLLTGDIRFLETGRNALAGNKLQDMALHVDLELARRQQDLETIRRLAQKMEGDDKSDSGHGRIPKELSVALALLAGQAPMEEVHELAAKALAKMQRWRAESDSDARRGTEAVILALLGRGEEATRLSDEVETAFPLERDQLFAADRLLQAATVHALLDDEAGVMRRLQALRGSTFVATNLCAVPYELNHQAIWHIAAARNFITQHCTPLWDRNRREMQSAFDAL